MNEETNTEHWCKLKSLYMTKSSSNMPFMKKQLYNLPTKEGMFIQQHLDTFKRILSDLLALKVKLEEEDMAPSITLFSSIKLCPLGDHHHVWKVDLRVGRYQIDAPEHRVDKEDRFHRGGLKFDCQRAKGEITD